MNDVSLRAHCDTGWGQGAPGHYNWCREEARSEESIRRPGSRRSTRLTPTSSRARWCVARLGPDPRGRVRTTPRITAPRETVAPADHVEGSHEDFAAPGVDRREIRKLKRPGVRSVEGSPPRLARYDGSGGVHQCGGGSLRRTATASAPCVCIVHGRGLHSEGNASVLKPRVRSLPQLIPVGARLRRRAAVRRRRRRRLRVAAQLAGPSGGRSFDVVALKLLSPTAVSVELAVRRRNCTHSVGGQIDVEH